MADSLDQPGFVPLTSWREYPLVEMIARSRAFAAEMQRRRTVRQFSERPVPREVIEACLEAAGTAPSGAHQQPWHFVAVHDPTMKHAIRQAAESAEAEFYATAPAEWLAVLAPLGTDAHKPYLDLAPWLIVVFAERYGLEDDGTRHTHYYVSESVGIATGFLLAALHHAGLVTLTHTPNPMSFLGQLLERPANERAVMMVVAGYPAEAARVPHLVRKPLDAIATFRSPARTDMITAREALTRLRDGNARFASQVANKEAYLSHTRPADLVNGQEPFAIILGCSDSRVPAEIVFDQGLGDLFVIRVAGNIVAPSLVGSVEFAAERFGTPLVVVLGHSQCSAVLATLDELQGRPAKHSGSLQSIVDRVRPAVQSLMATDLRDKPEQLLHEAVRANIRASAAHLRHGSRVLEQSILDDGLLVVGAEYSLETGVVDFFDGIPDRA